MITRFINYCIKKNLATKTIGLYQRVLHSILNVENNSHQEIKKIISNTKYNASTQQTLYTIYKTFCTYYNLTKRIQDLSCLKLKQKEQRYFDVLSYEQIKKLTAYNHKDTEYTKALKVLVRFMFETGIRFCEIKTLHEKNSNLYVIGKGQKLRQIFYNLSTWLKLKTLLRTTFKSLALTTLNKHIKRILGVQYSPHSLRRSFASYMLINGAQPKMVQLQLGHSDISTTFTYQQLSSEQNKNIYNNLMLKS